nr:NADH dehydrogenase subunit 4 [Morbakka sp. MKL-2023]
MLIACIIFPLLAILRVSSIPSTSPEKLWSSSLRFSTFSFVLVTLLWSSQSWSFIGKPICFSIVEPLLNALPLGPLESISLEIDSLSCSLIVLSYFLIPLCIIISKDSIKILIKEFCIILFLTEIILGVVFSVSDLILFYIFFEGTLIPLFIIIGVWGSREEKIKAAFYFFIFTLVGSLFMLLSIFKIYSLTGVSSLSTLSSLSIPPEWELWVASGLVLGLAIKVPMFPAHIWLPQAHVEAPVAGSVLLAGIMLKLGGYGLIKFCWGIVPVGMSSISPLLITVSVLGVLYGGLLTCRQSDMKRLIAYSSVAHMGIVTAAIFNEDLISRLGGIFMMLAHGIVSSSLFIAVTFLYSRSGSRLIRFHRGIAAGMPLFCSAFVILNLANMALPLSSNFIAEFISIVGIFREHPLITMLLASGVVISAVYSLLLVNRVCFGSPNKFLISVRDTNRLEFITLIIFLIPAYQLGIFPSWVLNQLQSSSFF